MPGISTVCVQIFRLTVFFIGGLSWASAQGVNPFESNRQAQHAGGLIFRSQCATCHGADARGISTVDAPDLTLLWTRATTTDESVFNIVKNGIPGSIMPAHSNPDAELWMVVAYLRSVAVTGTTSMLDGNSRRGANLFDANCATCHRVGSTGGSLGPNLTRVTARRSIEALYDAVRNPSGSISRDYKPVVLVTKSQHEVVGTLKSEDAFSIQIMDENQRLKAFLKTELEDIQRRSQSIMPAFNTSQLSDRELNDVFTYLQSN